MRDVRGEQVLGQHLEADGEHQQVGGGLQDRLTGDQSDEEAGGEPHGDDPQEDAGEHDPHLAGQRHGRHDVVQAEGQVGQLHVEDHHPERARGGDEHVAALGQLGLLGLGAEVGDRQVDQVQAAHQQQPAVAHDPGGGEQHGSPSQVRAEQACLERRHLLTAEHPVDRARQGPQRAGPGDRFVARQRRDHGPQDRGVVDGQDALQVDQLEDDQGGAPVDRRHARHSPRSRSGPPAAAGVNGDRIPRLPSGKWRRRPSRVVPWARFCVACQEQAGSQSDDAELLDDDLLQTLVRGRHLSPSSVVGWPFMGDCSSVRQDAPPASSGRRRPRRRSGPAHRSASAAVGLR